MHHAVVLIVSPTVIKVPSNMFLSTTNPPTTIPSGYVTHVGAIIGALVTMLHDL